MSFFTSFCDLPQKEQHRLPFDSSLRRSTIYRTYRSPTSHEPVNRPNSKASLGRPEPRSKRGKLAECARCVAVFAVFAFAMVFAAARFACPATRNAMHSARGGAA